MRLLAFLNRRRVVRIAADLERALADRKAKRLAGIVEVNAYTRKRG